MGFDLHLWLLRRSHGLAGNQDWMGLFSRFLAFAEHPGRLLVASKSVGRSSSLWSEENGLRALLWLAGQEILANMAVHNLSWLSLMDNFSLSDSLVLADEVNQVQVGTAP